MDGSRIETHGEIEEELTHYFAKILNEDIQDRERDIAQITRLIPPSVTREVNEMLVKPVTLQEVEEAVNQMALGKSPGPDGFTSNFFHYFWYMVKEEVVEIVEESRKKKGVLKAFNATFLSLIPKETGADRLDKFRPIALCNVVYKIISKVIANRLKTLLPSLICRNNLVLLKGAKSWMGLS